MRRKGKLLGAALAALLSQSACSGTATTTLSTSYSAASGTPTLLFTMGEHTDPLPQSPPYQYNGGPQVSSGNQCTWTFPHPVSAGDTIVGYTHLADSTDTYPGYTTAISFGSTSIEYNSSPVQWVPFPEDIQLFYLRNVPGGVTTISMTIKLAGGVLPATACADIGVAVYSGVQSVVPVAPTLVSGTAPSVTITPTAPALIWGFASPYGNDTAGALTSPSGYSLIQDDLETDDIGVWGSNSLVSTPQTLAWSAPQGAIPPGCSFATYEACPTVIAAVALQGSTVTSSSGDNTIINPNNPVSSMQSD